LLEKDISRLRAIMAKGVHRKTTWQYYDL